MAPYLLLAEAAVAESNEDYKGCEDDADGDGDDGGVGHAGAGDVAVVQVVVCHLRWQGAWDEGGVYVGVDAGEADDAALIPVDDQVSVSGIITVAVLADFIYKPVESSY